jgi:sulfate permease, SulP family
MSTPSSSPVSAAQPTFAELYAPKLFTILREGYTLKDLRADAIAGLTVAIVALPLSMAIAVASGVGPERGLYTAIVGGFLISLLGGSRFQIGGPAGAFIVLVALIVEREGYDGLVLATLIAGAILIAVGFLRVGAFIKYIPYPVTIGFTAGIAVIIVASQVRELTGLSLDTEPAAFLPKLMALWEAAATTKPTTIAVSVLSLATVLAVHRWRPAWPAFLIGLVGASIVTALLQLDVATLGSRFGAMPSSLPMPSLPSVTWDKFVAAIPNGCAIALLGAIESLLSAVIADGMTGRRHRSNCELVAQGVANIGSVAFGGICATGTIARTATNVRAGAKGPIAGLFHSGYLLLFVLIAAPLVAYVPLAALGAVLLVVAWNMAEKSEFLSLLRSSPADAVVLLTTFLLTVFVDLATAIMVGVVLGAFLFLHRMAEAVEFASGVELVTADQPDFDPARTAYDSDQATDPDVMIYRISGTLFFGATAALSTVLDRVGAAPRTFVLDFSNVPLIDITAANALRGFARKLERSGTRIYFAGARPIVRRTLQAAGFSDDAIRYADTAAAALRQVKTNS